MSNSTQQTDFHKFRQEYNLPAADARVILEKLGYKINKVDEGGASIHFTSRLPNQYSVSNEYLLKHAVLEYRRTMDIKKTLAGEFFELEVENDVVKGRVGISTIDEKFVKPTTPSLKRKPNEPASSVLVKAAPTGLAEQSAVAGAADALQVLVAALTEAQRASQTPETLAPQKQLLEAEQQGFLITTEQLGQLLGMSKGTISSKKSGFRRLGFEFEKVKEGATTLWKSKRY
jgi:biotin operon repressor